MTLLKCVSEAYPIDAMIWAVYAVSAMCTGIAIYCGLLMLIRREIKTHMRGLVISGAASPRNKLGQFVSRK